MSELIIVIGLGLMVAACIIIVITKRNEKNTFDTIEGLLHLAMKGEFSADNYDESRLSKLEAQLTDYLRISAISAKNVADERDKIKSLISDISHQTKTPIANLILYSELLESEQLPEEARANVEAIHTQAEKLRFLIDSLVKLSRLENGILELHPHEAPIGPILKDLAAQMREKAEAKGIALEVHDTDLKAVIDGKWTQEALGNIVDNAVKYTDKGSVVVSANAYEMFVRVDVKDTGIGIPEEEHAKVFQRFFRGSLVSTREGVGIGLHLAREIVSGEGGFIKLGSKPGEGTLFSVFLPRK